MRMAPPGSTVSATQEFVLMDKTLVLPPAADAASATCAYNTKHRLLTIVFKDKKEFRADDSSNINHIASRSRGIKVEQMHASQLEVEWSDENMLQGQGQVDNSLVLCNYTIKSMNIKSIKGTEVFPHTIASAANEDIFTLDTAPCPLDQKEVHDQQEENEEKEEKEVENEKGNNENKEVMEKEKMEMENEEADNKDKQKEEEAVEFFTADLVCSVAIDITHDVLFLSGHNEPLRFL
mmetsp:Transcript_37243/g.54630  ORF Transcript_37243/g.54630 Transcript_37243/m.54630 type:complete len:236 (+) Transcript_37243:510-1217(+)